MNNNTKNSASFKTNVDPKEIEKFRKISSRWWDTTGDLKTLHQMNPIRMQYIKEHCALSNAHVLDIGCGGGILSESLARENAKVTGIDMNEDAIDVARLHALENSLTIDYQHKTAEYFAEFHPNQFDIITCLELLEHVPKPWLTIQATADCLKPGGVAFFSTLNRTPKAYLQAILGAEYILQLLPKGTHHYKTFIRPSELAEWCRHAGLELSHMTGVKYNPFSQHFSFTKNVSVNYLMVVTKT